MFCLFLCLFFFFCLLFMFTKAAEGQGFTLILFLSLIFLLFLLVETPFYSFYFYLFIYYFFFLHFQLNSEGQAFILILFHLPFSLIYALTFPQLPLSLSPSLSIYLSFVSFLKFSDVLPCIYFLLVIVYFLTILLSRHLTLSTYYFPHPASFSSQLLPSFS